MGRHVVKLCLEVFVVAGKFRSKRRQVDRALDLIQRVRSGKTYLANPRATCSTALFIRSLTR